MKPTRAIVEFVVGFDRNDLSDQASAHVKASIMDYVGVTLAGTDEQSAVIVRRIAAQQGGAAQATVWGTGERTTLQLAALANGTAAHALELDDASLVMMAHPSIQLLPALFALAEHTHASGEDLMVAYAVGFEVGVMLGKALNPELVRQGWLPVGTLGVLMETAASARLLGLSDDQTEMALGIAANLAAGLRCNNGTMAKPLVSGTTGSNAILACLLAREGMTASREAIEGRHAFFDNFSRAARTQLDAAFATPVESRDVLATGLFYKLYPCCAGSHASIDCALEIAREHLPLAEEIVEIEVEVPEGVRDLLIHSKPSTETEAKFSLEYCVAAALADSQMGAAQFVPSRVADTNLQSLMGRVKPVYLPGRSTASRLQVRMRNGQVYSSSTERARGMPGSALPWAELENKFRQCVSEILPLAVADAVLDRLRRFEDIGDVADFVAGLVQPRT